MYDVLLFLKSTICLSVIVVLKYLNMPDHVCLCLQQPDCAELPIADDILHFCTFVLSHFKTIVNWWTQERNWVPRLLPQFLVVSSCATHIHPGWRKRGNQKPLAKKLKKKKMSHKCNWMCGWFVVFQCCFDGYFMLLELKSPKDTNNFSFQFIRSLFFFPYFFAGVGLGFAERCHFLLLVTFTLGLPPLPPHRVTWVKAMESCVASTSNCSSPKWSFTSKWVVLTYNASGSRVARYCSLLLPDGKL